MFAFLKGRLNCVRGRHERSSKRARKEGNIYLSVCRHCGIPMRRIGKREWIVDAYRPDPKRAVAEE